MAAPRSRRDPDRLLVRDGLRHFRRHYSLAEVRWGFAVLAVLLGIALWVIHKGEHPDPELFAINATPLDKGNPPAERAPLPEGLATAGWTETAPSHFDESNLYEKIDGRADFFKSFGFQRLHFISLIKEPSETGSQASIDIEMYDLGSARNALGAYAAERSAKKVPVRTTAGGMGHIDRNALFLTRGRYYVRAVGSDDAPVIQSQLKHLQRTFEKLAGAPLPWGYALLAGKLGLDPGRVSYARENALSFGFANNVYSGRLDDSAELFVTVASSDDAAQRLAQRFQQGFADYGSAAGSSRGITWVKDRYLNTLAGVWAAGRWIIGIRGARDRKTAAAALQRLTSAVADTPIPSSPDQGNEAPGETGDGKH